MSIVTEVAKSIMREIRPLMGIVEFVTDIVMDADGTATMKGAKSDDEVGHPIDAAVAWQLGFYSRPLDGASGVVVKAGGRGGVAFLVGWRNRQYELSLDKGDVAMANEAGAVVKLDKDGKITADATTGQLVALQGENYSAPKTEDLYSAIDTFFTQFSTAAPIIVLPSGNPSPALIAAANVVKGLLSGATLKSTKVKYG